MAEKPNILLIMCDQLRADVLGCYGNQLVKTPNIDRLKDKGIIFNKAYSQTPVCVPARHGLIAGQNPFELGLVDNGPIKKEITNPLPEMIRNQGYFTCAVGKMHFKPARKHYGFDRMFLSEEIPNHIQDDDYLQFLKENGYGDIIEPHGERSEKYYVPQLSELPEEMHTTAWTATKTCEMIRENKDRPFFIFSSFIKPHPPFDPVAPYDKMYPLEDIPGPSRIEAEIHPDDISINKQNDYKVNGLDHVDDEALQKMRSYYYGSVSQIDKQIGNILETLDENGLTENTLIVFTSDHGEMLGDHYSFGKRTFYEQSARIPMIISWPSALPKGEVRDQLVMLKDVYGTTVSASGGEIPGSSSARNLLDVIKDSGMQFREKVFAEFGRRNALKFMLRFGDYKYIYHTNGGLDNLFNLADDPEELCDIASEHAELCKNCRDELVAYYKMYEFDDAIDGNQLVKYEYEKHVPKGYLNQRPRWPKKTLGKR